MEVSAKKTKLITNSINGIQREIKIKGQKLSTLTNFEYLEAIVTNYSSKPKVFSSVAQVTEPLRKLTTVL